VINPQIGFESLTVPGHQSTITAIQFSADTATLVSGDDSGAVLFQDFKSLVDIFDATPPRLLRDAEDQSGLRTDGFILRNSHSATAPLQ
jgi:hypothetical protein